MTDVVGVGVRLIFVDFGITNFDMGHNSVITEDIFLILGCSLSKEQISREIIVSAVFARFIPHFDWHYPATAVEHGTSKQCAWFFSPWVSCETQVK